MVIRGATKLAEEQEYCPICKRRVQHTGVGYIPHCRRYTGCACGPYIVLDHRQFAAELGNGDEWGHLELENLRVLLKEWRYRRTRKGASSLPVPLLWFNDGTIPEINGAVPLRVSDLLEQGPKTFFDHIERAFRNIVDAHGFLVRGQKLELQLKHDEFLLLTDLQVTFDYFLETMIEYRWLRGNMREEHSVHKWSVEITPKGWAKYDEFTCGGRDENPVFVAMWFGGKDRKEQLWERYNNTFVPAIENAGYVAKRADEIEHNGYIMDAVFDSIRQAPFVVADLTDGNEGVYFEAGYAKGLGTDVIYCCPEEPNWTPHFDVSAVNQVRYKDDNDLKMELTKRIINTRGKGPC